MRKEVKTESAAVSAYHQLHGPFKLNPPAFLTLATVVIGLALIGTSVISVAASIRIQNVVRPQLARKPGSIGDPRQLYQDVGAGARILLPATVEAAVPEDETPECALVDSSARLFQQGLDVRSQEAAVPAWQAQSNTAGQHRFASLMVRVHLLQSSGATIANAVLPTMATMASAELSTQQEVTGAGVPRTSSRAA